MTPRRVSYAHLHSRTPSHNMDATVVPGDKSLTNMSVRLQKLLDIKGFSDAKVDKLLESAKALKNTGFMSGTEG